MSGAVAFGPESRLEAEIMRDPEWRRGVEWGDPRPGHPEGAVKYHLGEVLANVDRYAADGETRRRLRLIALTHDTFKHLVDRSRPRVGENHHGTIARRFIEPFIKDDTAVLDIIELHDEAYNAYLVGHRRGDWVKAEERARRLIERLGANLELYLTFYRCDNETGDKSVEPYDWFSRLVSAGEGPRSIQL
jgi:hypothetical protein